MPGWSIYTPKGFKWYLATRWTLIILPVLVVASILVIKLTQPELQCLYELVYHGAPPYDPLYVRHVVVRHENDHWYELEDGGFRAAVYTTKEVPDIRMWVQIHAEYLHPPIDPKLECPYDDTWVCLREISRMEFRSDWQFDAYRWIEDLPF